MKRMLLIWGWSLLGSSVLLAQAALPAHTEPYPVLQLKRTHDKMVMDGELKEQAWFAGHPAHEFWQNFPTDTIAAAGKTEIYMTYDADNLYVGVKCHSQHDRFVIPSLRRDYRFRANDNISLLFDTYNDQTNAFLFGMNPYGVRREALISNGGRQRGDFQGSWDNKWYGEAKIYEDFWVAEFAIPFKTLRYKEGSTRWRFNSYRFDTQYNEISTWIQIPRNQIIMDLGFMGEMQWEEPLKKAGKNISIIPYGIAGVSRNFTDPDQTRPDWRVNAGADAKVAISSGLNLDLTLNPDFSQVEVDRQVTNLDRFEIFFPERRQFFLENADLFGSFGLTRVNPFFSRRIGVAVDTATGQNVQNAIVYGARLSGKLNEGLRVGLLNMQTARQQANGLPGFNYSVLALQQQVFSRSNFSAIVVNKQAMASVDPTQVSAFNRVMGLEYRIGSQNNRWSGKVFFHKAFTDSEVPDQFSQGVQVEYLQRRYRLEIAQLFVGAGFDAEVGFVPRKDFMILSPEAGLFFYPKSSAISQHSLNADFRLIYKPGKDENPALPAWGLADRELELVWETQFANNAQLGAELAHNYTVLLQDFDPTRLQADSIFLAAGSAHTYTNLTLSYSSDTRKPLSFQLMPSLGQFFNGNRRGVAGSITWRYQPYGSVSLDYGYNFIKLADPFEPVNLWLVGPRIDLTFSKNLFLTTFIQYNSQLDNLNINARLQWRFQPVSDFFLVYTDNYLVDPHSSFTVRNRALVAKLTYWLNL